MKLSRFREPLSPNSMLLGRRSHAGHPSGGDDPAAAPAAAPAASQAEGLRDQFAKLKAQWFNPQNRRDAVDGTTGSMSEVEYLRGQVANLQVQIAAQSSQISSHRARID